MTEESKKHKNFAKLIFNRFKNRNVFVFLLFLIISASLWFLNYINKEHTTTIYFPFKFENLPNEASLSDENPSQLKITIRGHGYNLLREIVEQVKFPIQFDAKSKTHSFALYNCPYQKDKKYVLTVDLIPIASRRLGNDIKLIEIFPDTLFFDFVPKYNKKVPVKYYGKVSLNPEYIFNGEVKLSPDSILISGLKNAIDTVSAVYCTVPENKIIGDSKTVEAKLKEIKGVKFITSMILLNFPVEKYSEKSLNINIVPINFPDDLEVKLIPSVVNVSFKVPLSLFESIQESNFEAIVDFEKNKNSKIEIEINSKNKYIQISHISPLVTSFVLERNSVQ